MCQNEIMKPPFSGQRYIAMHNFSRFGTAVLRHASSNLILTICFSEGYVKPIILLYYDSFSRFRQVKEILSNYQNRFRLSDEVEHTAVLGVLYT